VKRSRRGVVLAVVGAAVAAAACSAPQPTASPALPSPGGLDVTLPALGPGLAALPLTIVDHGAIVRDGVPVDSTSDTFDTRIVAVPGRDDAVLLQWLGGACDERVVVTIAQPDTRHYRVAVDTQRADVTCPAVGIPRALLLELVKPVPVAAFDPVR